MSHKSSESSNINRIEKNPVYKIEDMLNVLRWFILGGENSSQMTKHIPIRRAPQKIKSDTVSTVSPSISHELMGPDAMILVF